MVFVVAMLVLPFASAMVAMAIFSLANRDRKKKWLDRLAERARWRHSRGVRGPRGRRAWRKLARAGDMEPVGDYYAAARAVRAYGATFRHLGHMTQWSSSATPGYAISEGSHIRVVAGGLIALRDLADKPQAAWRHADLAIALAAAPLVNNCVDARPLYELLCACLQQRFGGEIGIGCEHPGTGAAEISANEIGISRGG